MNGFMSFEIYIHKKVLNAIKQRHTQRRMGDREGESKKKEIREREIVREKTYDTSVNSTKGKKK